MKALSTIFFVVFVLNGLYSQYKSDYILKTETDTVYGTVRKLAIYQPIEFCEFTQENTLKKKYSPNELYGYGFADGREFYSKKVFVDEKDTAIFVEKLFDGTIDLYGFRFNKKDRFYFERDSMKLVLINAETFDNQSNQNKTRGGGEYVSQVRVVGQLNMLMSGCPKMQKLLGTYVTNKVYVSNESRLVKVLTKYEKSCQSKSSYKAYDKQGDKKIYAISAFSGVAYPAIKFSSSNQYWDYLTKADVDKTFSLMYGMSFSFNMPSVSNQFFITFSGYKTHLRHEYSYSNNLYESNCAIDFDLITGGIKGEYVFGTNKFELIPGIGFWYGKLMDVKTNTLISAGYNRKQLELMNFTWGINGALQVSYGVYQNLYVNLLVNYDISLLEIEGYTMVGSRTTIPSFSLGLTARIGEKLF